MTARGWRNNFLPQECGPVVFSLGLPVLSVSRARVIHKMNGKSNMAAGGSGVAERAHARIWDYKSLIQIGTRSWAR